MEGTFRDEFIRTQLIPYVKPCVMQVCHLVLPYVVAYTFLLCLAIVIPLYIVLR